ncbi:MAG: PorT family protein [Bacteroidetes bacterium]|nr:PorT family protein [Bacteroidota bacterium]
MKKILLIFLCLNTASAAQVKVGLLGGINHSNIFSDKSITPKFTSTNNAAIGGIINLDLFDSFSLLLEPGYIEKGADYNFPSDLKTIFSLSMSYIEIPMLLKYTTGGIIRPYIIAGPILGLNLSSELEMGLAGFHVNVETKDMTRTINIGLALGCGLEYTTERINLFIETRYNYSFNDISKPGMLKINFIDSTFRENINENPNLNIRSFQFLFGFLLPITTLKN